MGVEILGALLAPRWPQMRSGPPVELHLEASWSLCCRQDCPCGAKMSQVGTKLAVKFGKLRTKRRILYIHKLPIHRKAATMLIMMIMMNMTAIVVMAMTKRCGRGMQICRKIALSEKVLKNVYVKGFGPI